MELYKDWEKYKKALLSDQAQRYQNEIENNKKLLELNQKFDLVQNAFDMLSEEQREMLKNFPRTKEDLDKFNEIGADMEEKEEELNDLWLKIDEVVDQLPFSDQEMEERFKKFAMLVMKKHNLNN